MSTNNQTTSGISVGFLTLIFFVLKIFNVITWSWWWVFSPLWLPIVLGFCFVIIATIFYIFYYLIKGKDNG